MKLSQFKPNFLTWPRTGTDDANHSSPVVCTFYPIQKGEELVDNSVRNASMIRPSARSQGVEIIQKENTRGSSICSGKQLSNLCLARPNVLIQKFGTIASYQVEVALLCKRWYHYTFPTAPWSI